jgi:hypothetical protein
MKIIKILIAMLLAFSLTASYSIACSTCSSVSPELVNFNKNDDKDDDDSDGNAGEPKKRDHKGRKHRGAE